MKTNLFNKIGLSIVLIVLSAFLFSKAQSQIRYASDGKLTIGNTQPYEFYGQTIEGSGMYFKSLTTRFLQLDVSPSSPRIAGTGNQVVFYNTKTSTFNSIQVANVYNYSDAKAKINVRPSVYGLSVISQLRPVTYQFAGEKEMGRSNNLEIGLLAQEVEKILPSIVYTDDEGKKLINYIALIPVLIESMKTLQAEVDELKSLQNK
ncbi:tail fiber domain-containing protein [Petrimonas sp.]|uniref:tail fiber domain-containing protein n=1 Tax=Petrimonas sp. TaxID=2023866 RepID=UPI003F51A9F6